MILKAANYFIRDTENYTQIIPNGFFKFEKNLAGCFNHDLTDDQVMEILQWFNTHKRHKCVYVNLTTDKE